MTPADGGEAMGAKNRDDLLSRTVRLTTGIAKHCVVRREITGDALSSLVS